MPRPNLEKFLEDDLRAIITLFIIAFGLRLIRLFDLDLIFDEVVLVIQAKLGFARIWELCRLDNFPPLYPWILKVWSLISTDPNWYRLFAALATSLTPPAAFLLGKELLDRRLGWFLGLALAISPCFMYYSQFIRMYNVQPLLVCLSLYGMLKAMKTNQWRYWFLMAFANLIGYYVYVFMVFFLAGQMLVLIYYNRLNVKAYLRPILAHIPFLVGLSFWVAPVLQRYGQVQEAFWSGRLTPSTLFRTCIFMGSGTDFRHILIIASAINLPIIIGVIFALLSKRKNQPVRISAFLLFFVLGVITALSARGSNFTHDRYTMFILPIYLGLSIYGWMNVENKIWRKAGLVTLLSGLFLSLGYYYIDYYYTHQNVGFVRALPKGEKNEGHCISLMAAEVGKRIGLDEVIIHYSTPYGRICTYLSYRYYSNNDSRVHIYSRKEIAQHDGQQYLSPGERIKYFSDLQPVPAGVWLITLNKSNILVDKKTLNRQKSIKWIEKENLPLELENAGYRLDNQINYGVLAALHYCRTTTIDNKATINQVSGN